MTEISNNGKLKPAKIRFDEFELDNGLQIILSNDSYIPSVAINLCYHVGSKDEDENKRGFAHLFEHLMFEGSKNVPQGIYDKLLTFAGGDNNAYTTEDKTNYYVLLPSNQLELGLWLESDRMLQFAITQDSLETQKEVVMEEKRQNIDNRPYGTVSVEFAPKLFKTSGYRWDPIGDMKDIKNATLSDVKNFFERFYIPNNAVLSITGDINKDETLAMIRKYFGGIKRGKDINRKNFNEPPLASETVSVIYDNIHFPGIFIGYRIPGEQTREQYAFDILSEILSSGESSRFYRELVYKKQLVSEIGCYADTKEYAGIFYIFAILMPGVKVDTVQSEIDNIVSEAISGNIKEEEIQKVKNRIEAKSIYRRQLILSKADMLAHFKTFYGDAELINTNLENYLKVTKEDIISSSQKYINPNNRVVLHYLPVQDKK
ncbi:MAG: pitrilysin family protein [Ignavibacteria bacterium]|jgi:predicted Zn-dependent peptidase